MFKKLLLALAVSFISLSVVADGHLDSEKKEMMQAPDVIDIAASNSNFSTLVAAVKAADLVEALKAEGPFTVFAPTNEAFAALPEGTVESLLKPENKEQLIQVLTYHVVPGKVMAADIAEGSNEVSMLQGTSSEIVKGKSGVTIDGANVVSADVTASNGVIHVIDKVILPQ